MAYKNSITLNRENRALKVTGRVQGVYYRATICQIANEMNLTGYVMNMPDWSVLIEVEGARDQLNEFRMLCEKGTVSSVVNEIVVVTGEVKGYTDFKIRY